MHVALTDQETVVLVEEVRQQKPTSILAGHC